MKCLVYCPEATTAWTKEYFGNINPYYIRLLNKPLLEYYIEFCVLNGIRQIRVIKNDIAMEMEEYFANGTKWGVEISYSLARKQDSLDRIILKNSGFCKNNDLLIIHGYNFINFNKNAISDLPKFEQSFILTSAVGGIYFLTNLQKTTSLQLNELPELDNNGISLTKLDGIKSYYLLCMNILKQRSDHFNLPGYSNEEGEFVGMNVIFNAHTVSFQKPLMIGDHVQIKNNSMIGPNTILGNNVIVDSSSTINDSIVYDQSYIGSDLEIEKKIVYRSSLINPETGDVLEIKDKFFVSGIEHNMFRNFFRQLIHSLLAIVLFILYALPNAIFGLLEILGGSYPQKGEFYASEKYNKIELPVWKMKRPKPLTLMFLRFSLDKYPLLVPVMFGRMSLVGNRMKQANSRSRKFIASLPHYRPGVFDYPGMFSESFTEEENEMHELYYVHHASIWMDIKIIFNTLFGRFFNVSNYVQNKLYK